MKLHLLFVMFLFKGMSFSQTMDSSTVKIKKNYLFIEPSSLPGDMGLDLDNFWLVGGYQRAIGKESFIQFKLGYIFKSLETGSSIVSPLNALHSNGMNTSFAYKRLITEKLYYDVTIFAQYTATVREEEYDYAPGKYVMSQYSVGRYVLGLDPHLGLQFVDKNHFYFDIALGVSPHYIYSENSGKKNLDDNLEKETWSKKIFDYGEKVAWNFDFQVKLGYNF